MSIRIILKNLIINYKYYLIFSYILTIFGIIINSYININLNFYFRLYFIVSFAYILYLFTIQQIEIDNNNTNKEYSEHGLNKWQYIKSLKEWIERKGIYYIKIANYLILILVPIIMGGYYHAKFISTSQSYLKLVLISFEMTLLLSILIRGDIFQKKQKLSVRYAILVYIILLFMSETAVLNILNKILDYINYNLEDAFTILIAIIMLCVGLSALSFAYCSILKEDSDIRCNMKRNGEGFFIASIFSMIAIFLLFITSFIKKYVIFMSLSNLNILSFDFIILNIYAVSIIIIFTFTIYASYCMLKYSILSLKELKLSCHFEIL